MNTKYLLLELLLALILAFACTSAVLWFVEEYRETGALRATGEEWQKLSNGYVSD